MRYLTRRLLGFGIALFVVQGARATLLFQDGFVYPTGTLAGNGAWTGASANIQVGNTSLTYPGLFDPGSGNDVTVTSGVAAGTTKANFTDTPITSGSLYYSFLAECTALPTANNYLSSLNASGGGPSGSADPLSVYVGQQVAGSQFKIGVRHTSTGTGATYTSNPTLTLGSTHFFVVEYTWGGVGGSVSLFVDPAPGTGSIQPTADVTVAGVAGSDAANLQVVGFKANSAATAGNWAFDTVRIGDTWADVTIPEPSATALFGVGVLGLAGWRRVRR